MKAQPHRDVRTSSCRRYDSETQRLWCGPSESGTAPSGGRRRNMIIMMQCGAVLGRLKLGTRVYSQRDEMIE